MSLHSRIEMTCVRPAHSCFPEDRPQAGLSGILASSGLPRGGKILVCRAERGNREFVGRASHRECAA